MRKSYIKRLIEKRRMADFQLALYKRWSCVNGNRQEN